MNEFNVMEYEIEMLNRMIKDLEDKVDAAHSAGYSEGYSDGWNNAMEDCDNRG
jgi:hypothetical protein